MTDNQDFYITSQAQLDELVALIKKTRIAAIDTEFTRQTTYYPILSIIQIAVKTPDKHKKIFIVDCLEKIDLSGFYAVMNDPEIVKILHSATQDLQIFHHKSGLQPHGVIDTQILANFCGYGFNVGYSSLVEKLFHESLDKKQQRSDWQHRPLSKKQIEYALLDVLYLEEIYEKFFEILAARNQVSWFFEEMQNFTQKILNKSEDNLTKNFSFRHKNARQIMQIKNLVSWRESWARKVDVPRQHLLKDEVIDKIVSGQKVELNFSKKMLQEMEEILEKLDEHPDRDPADKKTFMSSRQKNCYQEAKKLISKIADRGNFKEQFLLTSSDLQKAICEPELFNEVITGWRHQLFGKELEQLISEL